MFDLTPKPLDFDTYRIGNTIMLPPGAYVPQEPIRDDSTRIASIDIENPAIITGNPLQIYAKDVEIDSLLFTGLGDGAISSRAPGALVSSCTFRKNISHIVAEHEITVRDCTLDKFTQDAIRCCGDNSTIEYNTGGKLITKDMKDRAHHDFFQGWAGNPNSPFRSEGRYDAKYTLRNITLRHNHITDLPGSPLQGIVFFDGLCDNWVIENNVIRLYSDHGVTIRGGSNIHLSKTSNRFTAKAKYQLLPARRFHASTKSWEYIPVSSADNHQFAQNSVPAYTHPWKI